VGFRNANPVPPRLDGNHCATALQEVLEAEMTGAAWVPRRGERTTGRMGYRSGYYGRTLITDRQTELRVPQDRAGRFSTRLFERYQIRSR